MGYTRNNPLDLATVNDPVVFCQKIRQFADQPQRILASDGGCAILIGDVRKNGNVHPLGLRTLDQFLLSGFVLDSIVLKTQHHDRSAQFYRPATFAGLLMKHEYLFILRKPAEASMS